MSGKLCVSLRVSHLPTAATATITAPTASIQATRSLTTPCLKNVGSCFVPTLNRFLSADSIVPNFTNPQSLNRYSYVLNSPLRYTDPTGHWYDQGGGTGGGGDYCSQIWCYVPEMTMDDVIAAVDSFQDAPWQFQLAVGLLCPACEAITVLDGFQWSEDWGVLLEAAPILGILGDVPIGSLLDDIAGGKYADDM
ncbi:MAG: hypothetical protein H6658_09475 [Ardenticatenaceae bacterium]|nr:hypothetical protein [Ardenticatenaceae bacterium]